MSDIYQPNLQAMDNFETVVAILNDYFWSFIREKNGTMIQLQPNTFSFYYYAQMQFGKLQLTIKLEPRRSSYKIAIRSQLIQRITLTQERMEYWISLFNSQQKHGNNKYIFQKPCQFKVECTIQKDSVYELTREGVRNYCKNLFECTISQYILAVCRLEEISNEDQFNKPKMKQMLDLVHLYKNFLTEEIANRNNIPNPQTKFKIKNANGLNPTVKREESKLNQYQMIRLNFNVKKLKGQKNPSSKDLSEPTKPLAHKILMMKQSVDTNWKAPESSYGNLQRVQAEYITISSLNDMVAQMIQKQRKQRELITGTKQKCEKTEKLNKNILVRKNYKKADKCICVNGVVNPKCDCYVRLKSYQAEIAIVSCIRNVMSDSVASYFLQIVGPQQAKVSKLYSKFYPKCLSNEKLKYKDMIFFIFRLFQALKLFDNLNILHRDLKPDNILIDSKKFPKVIDFGSAWILNRTFLQQANIQLNPKLYTTRKYNLYYDDGICCNIKNKMTAEEYQQHPLYDIHAFGIIVKQIITLPNGQGLTNPIRLNLDWLALHCINADPNLRPNIDQIENYLNLMIKLWNVKLIEDRK